MISQEKKASLQQAVQVLSDEVNSIQVDAVDVTALQQQVADLTAERDHLQAKIQAVFAALQ